MKKTRPALASNRANGIKPLPKYCGVYFLRWGDYVKVGYAYDVVARRKAVECGIPTGDVVPIGWIPCGNHRSPGYVEAQVHDALSADHVRGEWFVYGQQVRAFIERHAMRWPA